MENLNRDQTAAQDATANKAPADHNEFHAVSHKAHCPSWCGERHETYPGEDVDILDDDPCYGPGIEVVCEEYPDAPLLALLLRHPGHDTVIEVMPTNGFARAEDGDHRTRTFTLDQARTLRDALDELLGVAS